MSIFKRGNVYWYKFMWQGQLVRESTRQRNDKIARSMESKHRSHLAQDAQEQEQAKQRLKCADVLRCAECERLFDAAKAIREAAGIFCSSGCCSAWARKHVQTPMLAEFLENDFLPFTESRFRTVKPKSADYYSYGARLLLGTNLGTLKIDRITSQQSGEFIAHTLHLSASTQNCGLRTLRRALKLAYDWGKLERPPKISLAKGERQRERVLREDEFAAYLELCRQPWRDVAPLIRHEGMCPGECYGLRWDNVAFKGKGGSVHVVKGKTKARRRLLPMVPEVRSMLHKRWEAQGRPTEGWVFPTESASGHLEESSAKIQHGDALRKLQAATSAYQEWKRKGGTGSWIEAVAVEAGLDAHFVNRHSAALQAGVKPFAPYCLRHTELTRLAESGCDAFTLARIAGHSSIVMTQRYCHPQKEAIEQAFANVSGGHKTGHSEQSKAKRRKR